MRLRARAVMLWNHLVRAAARRAWVIVVVCFAIYVALDARGDWPQLQEFVLIVAGVAAGAIFLPELSASLWDLDPDRIRGLVPLPKVRGLHRAVLDASLDGDEGSRKWSQVVWSEAVEPLLAAGHERRSVVWDLAYDIGVHPGREVTVGALAVPTTFVTTRLRSRRVLPVGADGVVWVSAARTSSALHNEFQLAGCILRELVPLPGVDRDTWREAVLEHCRVTLNVGGRSVPLVVAHGEPIPDLVRWEATLAPEDRRDEHVMVEISFDFPLDPATTTFPVLFPRYFCAGATRVAFTLYTQDPSLQLEAQPFLAHAPGRSLGDTAKESTKILQRYVFQAPPESLVWPGSGVHFEWTTRVTT
ncbi:MULTISPECIES: hypothetical protein [unclassified Actinotalea]|uniref:hypothetical protein n=1 Tax=unclassified Actinotalea TaxID=2638618 RepID=UPI0015F595F5|nr:MULTISPECIES: hypothetical protein [unclassified Actinotalea]